MTNNTKGWIIFLGAIGMMLGLMSGDVRELESWSDMKSPLFISDMLAHIGVVIGAFLAGKIMPARGE